MCEWVVEGEFYKTVVTSSGSVGSGGEFQAFMVILCENIESIGCGGIISDSHGNIV